MASMQYVSLRAGELLAFGLQARDHGHGHVLLGESAVNLQHAAGLLDGLVGRGVGRVAFLPEELGRAKEQPGAHLPPHDVHPLVDEQRQVAPRLNPPAVHAPDDRFGGGAQIEGLFEFGPAAVRHDGALGREPLDVLSLLLEEGLRDEHRKIRVDVSRFLEHAVQGRAHVLPEGEAVGPDDHASLHRRIVGQFGAEDQIGVPARVVLGSLGQAFCHGAYLLSSLSRLRRNRRRGRRNPALRAC